MHSRRRHVITFSKHPRQKRKSCRERKTKQLCTYNVTLWCVRVDIVTVESNSINILIVCVSVFVAFVIQHATHKRHITLSSVASGFTVPYLFTVSHERYRFLKKNFQT